MLKIICFYDYLMLRILKTHTTHTQLTFLFLGSINYCHYPNKFRIKNKFRD